MANKQSYHITKTRIILFLIVCILIGASFIFTKQIESFINTKITKSNENVLYTDGLEVHFINVGQGDSIAIKLPDDKNMIIDAGPKSSSETLINYLNSTYFKDKTNKKIDYLVLTHSDEDHIGGAVSLFNEFEILTVYRPQIYTQKESDELGGGVTVKDTAVYKNTIQSIADEKSTVNYSYAGTKISSTSTDAALQFDLKFLSPNKDNYSDVYDFSPIIILSYKIRKFMFTGDAESEVENEVLNLYSKDILDIDILKVGHHGSSSSSSINFLQATTPEIAIIEVGKDNKYGHPTEKTITNLKNVGAKIYRTDENKNIVVSVNRSGELGVALDNQAVVYIKYYYVAGTIFVIAIVFIFAFPTFKNKKNKKQNQSLDIEVNNKNVKIKRNGITQNLKSTGKKNTSSKSKKSQSRTVSKNIKKLINDLK